MVKLYEGGAYLVNGTDIIADGANQEAELKSKTGSVISKEEAAKNTIAYSILKAHNTSDNMEILIDADDYDKVKDYCWCISKGRKWEYAMTRIKNETVLLHRFIMNLQSDMVVDHINGNTLDNRKSNLRICTNQQNCFNHAVSCNNSSGYTGVTWHRLANKWQVHIRFNKKTLYLGLFENIDDAVAVRKQAEKQYFGEYARGEKVI